MSTLVTLPADVQLLILDYIRLPSHLKAICLASKAWDELARPLLYRKVTINVFDEDEVARFERCMNAGAQAHLDGTRSLTLMDSLPPPEAPEFQVQAHRHFYKAEKLRPVEIGQIRAVLAYFLPNRLHTFRFLSTLSFHAETAHDLFRRQAATLTHVHLRLDDFTLLNSLQCVKTADLWLPYVYADWVKFDEERLMTFFSQISSYKQMERLHIGTESGQEGKTYDHSLGDSLAKAFSCRSNHSGRLENLRQLTLSGVALSESLYEGISKIISFSQLTHLTLWGSPYAVKFACALAHGLGSHKLQLKHLGLYIHNNDINLEDFDTLLYSCTELKSLCLEWDCWNQRSFESLMACLRNVGQQLILLSIHNAEDHNVGCGDTVVMQGTLEKICLACPNLEQFGYRITEKSLMSRDDFHSSLLPIHKLSKLRTLHLRQAFLYGCSVLAYFDNLTHCLAREFFADLEQQSRCPSLDTLIIGQERQIRRGDVRSHSDPRCVKMDEHEPARCFRSRRLMCNNETKCSTPYLISLAEFRATSDYAEILDWQTAYEPFSDWMWRLPGRFNDD